jgi:hypothetical protein
MDSPRPGLRIEMADRFVDTMAMVLRQIDQSAFGARGDALARIFHKESAARRDKPASTSLRSLAVLTLLSKYASARQPSRALYPRASDASRCDPL